MEFLKTKDIIFLSSFHQKIFKNINIIDNYNSNTTKLAGTGLGISQKIAEGLNSKIQFSSIVGVGSKFWISLKTRKINKYENQKHGQLIRCKTMEKDDLIVFKKYNFTYSKKLNDVTN